MKVHYRPGKRAMKTAIASALCIVYGIIVGRSPVIAAIAAIICLKPTRNESFSAMVHRLLGTLIGGLLGLAAAVLCLVLPGNNAYWSILIVPLLMLLCITLCNIARIPQAIVLGCAVLAIVGTAYDQEAGALLLYAMQRMLDTAVGAVLAVGVNQLLWPFDNAGPPPEGGDPAQEASAESADNASPLS